MIHTKHFVLAALLSTAAIVRAEECPAACPKQKTEQCADRSACQADACAQEEAQRSCCDNRSEEIAEEAPVAEQATEIALQAVLQVGEQKQELEGNIVPGQETIINVSPNIAFVTQVVPVAEENNEIDINVVLLEKTEDDQAKEHGRCTVRTAWGKQAEFTCQGADIKLFVTAHKA